MIEYNKIFLDTSPLIYFLDEDVNYASNVEKIHSNIFEKNNLIVTSVITSMEYLTIPFRMNNKEKVNAFFEFIGDCDIPIYTIDMEISKKAAMIRGEYKNFKAMDCLQLATACIGGCDLFLTNDKQLQQFKEITCMTIDEVH